MEGKIKLNKNGEILDDIKFGDKTDIFNRKNFGESLSNLILNSENESLVISINADWGEGKTDFFKRWNNYLLEEKGLNTIYFNSFKNDYIEDPFIPLLGEILNIFGEKSFIKGLYKKGINILKGIGPLVGKVGARWLMKGNSEQIDDDLEKLIEGDIVKEIGKKLEKYLGKDKEIQEFKKTLEEIIKKSKEKQLVFIIDELDRCRPDFALRLLERIKHFFDVKGLYFVLGINKKQIKAYITKIYGDIDSTTYLQKFIDIETILPKDIENGGDIKKYINKIIENNIEIFNDKGDRERLNSIVDILGELSLNYNCSLRDIEKIVNYLIIFRKALGKEKEYMFGLIIILIFLKIFNQESYIKLKLGKLNKDKLISILNLKDIKDLFEDITFIFDKTINSKLLGKYSWLQKKMSFFDIESYEGRQKVLEYHFGILESFNI